MNATDDNSAAISSNTSTGSCRIGGLDRLASQQDSSWPMVAMGYLQVLVNIVMDIDRFIEMAKRLFTRRQHPVNI